MLRSVFIFILTVLFLASCQSPKDLLNPDALSRQSFEVRPGVDTVLVTAEGIRLAIDKQTFEGKEPVHLNVRAALRIQDMIAAGLLTSSPNGILSSGGMLQIEAEGSPSIHAPIRICVPTSNYDPGMQLYTGKDSAGKVQWTDPRPLDTVPYTQTALYGRQVFQQNCATCHALDKDLTGPALAWFKDRGPWAEQQQVYKWIHNTGKFMGTDLHTSCLQHKFGAIMQSFPQLDEKTIDCITEYVQVESARLKIPRPNEGACADSCRRYQSALSAYIKLADARQTLIDSNGPRFLVERYTSDSVFMGRGFGSEAGTIEKVTPPDYNAVYYQFSIKAFGWYNVDDLLSEKASVDAYLAVRVADEKKSDYSVTLVIPKYKVIEAGGPLKGKPELFGFHTPDGRMPLPQNEAVLVFAVSEVSEGILFDYQVFQSGRSQTITLHPKVVSKETFNSTVKSWSLAKISIEANDSRNAAEIHKLDKELDPVLQQLDRIRPRNCACACIEGRL